jgi:hypothetical protein
MKKLLSALLVAVMLFSLVSCGFEKKLEGFIAASAGMSDVTNSSTSVNLLLKTGSAAKSASLSEIVERFATADTEAKRDLLVKELEVSLNVLVENYGPAYHVGLTWSPTNHSLPEESILEFYLDGNILYINTDIINLLMTLAKVGGLDDSAITQLQPILDLFKGYKWVQLDIGDILADDTIVHVDLPDDELDIPKYINVISNTLSESFKDNAALVLTEEFDKVLTQKGDMYTLKLDYPAIISLSKEVLNLLIENEDAVIKSANKISSELGLDFTPIEDKSELHRQLTDALNTVNEDKLTTKFNLIYSVGLTGKDNARVQKYDIQFDGDVSTFGDIPDSLDYIKVGVTGTTKVQSSKLTIPTDAYDLMGLLESLGALGGSGDDWTGEYDDYGDEDDGWNDDWGSEDVDYDDEPTSYQPAQPEVVIPTNLLPEDLFPTVWGQTDTLDTSSDFSRVSYKSWLSDDAVTIAKQSSFKLRGPSIQNPIGILDRGVVDSMTVSEYASRDNNAENDRYYDIGWETANAAVDLKVLKDKYLSIGFLLEEDSVDYMSSLTPLDYVHYELLGWDKNTKTGVRIQLYAYSLNSASATIEDYSGVSGLTKTSAGYGNWKYSY